MVLFFRSKNELLYFFLGIIFIALPVGIALEYVGVSLDVYEMAALGAFGALLIVLLDKFLARRKMERIALFWVERQAHDLAEASKRYPIKNKPDNSAAFDTHLAYFNELSDISKREGMKKFKLSEKDWHDFLGYMIMKSKNDKTKPQPARH
ncbi:MAG: hypothetical protein WDN10_01830 [bacterium]